MLTLVNIDTSPFIHRTDTIIGCSKLHELNKANLTDSTNLTKIIKYTNLLKNYVEKILDSDYDNINIHVMDKLVYSITNYNLRYINTILYNAYDTSTSYFKEWVQNNCSNKDFSDNILEKYRLFTNSTNILKKSLNYYNKSVGYSNELGEIIQFNDFIKSAMFYKNVIASTYTLDGIEYEFFSLIAHNVINCLNFKLLHNFITMQSFYKQTYEKFKTNILFPEITLDLISAFENNVEFIKKLVENIDILLKKTSSSNLNNNISGILDIIKVVSVFKERKNFDIYYKIALSKRLFLPYNNFKLEQKIINIFSHTLKTNESRNMICMINDIENSHTSFNDMKIIKFLNDSKSFSLETFENYIKNKKNVVPYVLKNRIWKDIIPSNSAYTLPDNIDIFLKFNSVCYSNRHPNRIINWKLDYGTAIVDILINGTNYEFLVTTPQMLVMMLFSSNSRFSGIEISQKLNMPLKTVGIILSSFIQSQIFKRDPGANNDILLKFYINKDFKCDMTKITLLNLINFKSNGDNDKLIEKSTNIPESESKFETDSDDDSEVEVEVEVEVEIEVDINSNNICEQYARSESSDTHLDDKLSYTSVQLIHKNKELSNFTDLENNVISNLPIIQNKPTDMPILSKLHNCLNTPVSQIYKDDNIKVELSDQPDLIELPAYISTNSADDMTLIDPVKPFAS
jgi:hypothetical protein